MSFSTKVFEKKRVRKANQKDLIGLDYVKKKLGSCELNLKAIIIF